MLDATELSLEDSIENCELELLKQKEEWQK